MEEMYISLLIPDANDKKNYMERVKKDFREMDIDMLKKQNGPFIYDHYPRMVERFIINIFFSEDIYHILCYLRKIPSSAVERFGEDVYFTFMEEIIEIVLQRDATWVPSYSALKATIWLDSDIIAKMFLDRCIFVHRENTYLKEDIENTLLHKSRGILCEAILFMQVGLTKLLLEYGWNLSMIAYYHSEKYCIRNLLKDPSLPNYNEEFYKMVMRWEEEFQLPVKEPCE